MHVTRLLCCVGAVAALTSLALGQRTIVAFTVDTGAGWRGFHTPVIDSSGAVSFVGQYEDGKGNGITGIWTSLLSGSGSFIFETEDDGDPLHNAIVTSQGGVVAFTTDFDTDTKWEHHVEGIGQFAEQGGRPPGILPLCPVYGDLFLSSSFANYPRLNAGHALFYAYVDHPPAPAATCSSLVVSCPDENNIGLWRFDSSAPPLPILLLRVGSTIPCSGGLVLDAPCEGLIVGTDLAINAEHQAALKVYFRHDGSSDPPVDGSNDTGILGPTQSCAITVIAREGAGAPGTSDNFDDLWDSTVVSDPAFNDSGHVVFGARTGANQRGIWGNIGGTLSLLYLEGQSAPGISGATFKSFGRPFLSNSGYLVFTARTNPGDVDGIWRRSPSGTTTLIVKDGDSTINPQGAFEFDEYSSNLALNESGVIVFKARVGTTGPVGLWAYFDGEGCGLYPLVFEGEAIEINGNEVVVSGFDLHLGSGGRDGRPFPLNDSNYVTYALREVVAKGTATVAIVRHLLAPCP